MLTDHKNILSKAVEEYSPVLIANFAYELAKTFNSFYAVHTVINEPDVAIRNFRLVLIAEVAETIKAAMGLLGIEVPEQM
jgi:arginyl-tRNA synthetase